MGLLDRLKSALRLNRVDVKERFELLREGIAGTMSKFYMARDRKTGQIVGLKILDPKKTAAVEERFKGLGKPSEGEIAMLFDHPYIVKTFEYGLTTDGCQYLVMEYLGGPGLNTVLATRAPLLEGNQVRYIRQAAEAVDVVHKVGFIHRDICPRNLILTEDCQTVKLTDFGLSVPATPPFMQPGNRTGTPNYMAPELVRRFPTDQRIDVFSFGVTAYEICTYELPWPRGSTGMAAMTHDQPPADIRKYRPKIHPRLAEAIHWCIQSDPHQRCPSMEKFLQAIRRVDSIDQK
ncbi:MAG TPA: serine/threonine-protein kinase [Thermoguttaceae bacterium]|nr:serine/threonine-protein kinase [Thermoguttaceae bacterium]